MKLTTLIAAAAMAVAPFAANALTVIDAGTVADGSTTNVGPLNIAADTFRVEALADTNVLSASGSLTIDTYVDPYQFGGTGAANILFAGAASTVSGDWGGVPISFTLIGSSWTADPISTSFAQAGLAGLRTLTLNWAGATKGSQISVVVQAVPLPAGALLLGTALVGLGFARRRQA